MLKDEINRMYNLDKDINERFKIVINDEDHTMGEAINYEIQSHADILKSSVSRPDLLVRKIVLDIVAFDKKKLINAINESIDNLIVKIDKFSELFKKIKVPKKQKK